MAGQRCGGTKSTARGVREGEIAANVGFEEKEVKEAERVGGVVAAVERNGGRVRPTARERGRSAARSDWVVDGGNLKGGRGG